MKTKKTNENLVNNSNQNENLIDIVDSQLLERLDKEQKLEIRDYIWIWVLSDFEQGIHEMTKSDSFWEVMESRFPHIKKDEISKEMDKYEFHLKMDF